MCDVAAVGTIPHLLMPATLASILLQIGSKRIFQQDYTPIRGEKDSEMFAEYVCLRSHHLFDLSNFSSMDEIQCELFRV
jgi:hypothetical protein